MLLDYNRFADRKPESWWKAGAVAFSVDMRREVSVELTNTAGEIQINAEISRHPIIRHAVALMREGLGVKEGFIITVNDLAGLTHVGLGSTPAIVTAVSSALNRLYGDQIPVHELLVYLIRNHGEEIEGDDAHLIPVQAMGAAAAVSLAGGGMVVLAGNATIIARMNIPETRTFIIAMPEDHKSYDSVSALAQDASTYSVLHAMNAEVPYRTSYDVLHSLLPAMTCGDLCTIGRVICKHRLSDEQVARFEKRYPGKSGPLVHLREWINDGRIDVLSVSSTGPTIFALTRNPDDVAEYLRKNAFKTFKAPPDNSGTRYETL